MLQKFPSAAIRFFGELRATVAAVCAAAVVIGFCPAAYSAPAPKRVEEPSKNPAAKNDAGPTVEVLASGLDHPCGVAVRDDRDDNTHEIFVVEGGAGRVVRLRKKKTDDSNVVQADGVSGKHFVPAVVDFKRSKWGAAPSYPSGPLSIVYKQMKSGPAIIVGDGGQPLQDLSVRVYQLPEEQKTAISCEKFDEKFFVGFNPPADGETGDAKAIAELNPKTISYLQGLALSNNTLFVAVNGEGPGQIMSADWNHTVKLRPLPRDAAIGELGQPTAVAVDAHGNLTVARMGDWGSKPDSELTILGPKSGKAMFQARYAGDGLLDTVALAYSVKPISSSLIRQLFTLDFAQSRPEAGGLFRVNAVEDGLKLGVTAEPLLKLDQPTAMAFAADGTLYVTIFGKSNQNAAAGQLLRIRL